MEYPKSMKLPQRQPRLLAVLLLQSLRKKGLKQLERVPLELLPREKIQLRPREQPGSEQRALGPLA